MSPTAFMLRQPDRNCTTNRGQATPFRMGCPSAVTARFTDKRQLTRRPDPCRGIVGRRVVPLSRSAPNAGLSRRDPYDVLSRLASRITGQRDLTLEREDQRVPEG